jgi:uncharacterized protein YndB with AHSA1/START domain
MKRDIKIEWNLPYSDEKVWDMLTKKELVIKWMPAISDFSPIVGFEFEQHQNARGDWDGILYHKVIDLIPLIQFSYTFQSGPKKGTITLDTLVTFKLTSDKNGTKLKLEHSGFVGAKNCMTSLILEFGWKNQIAKRFKSILAEDN